MLKLYNYLFQNLKTKRFNVFVLFFFIAFSILIMTKLSGNYSQLVVFKVNLKEIPKDIVITNQEDVVLKISMEASGFSWLIFMFKNPEINLSLENDFDLKQQQYHYNKTKTTKQLTSKISDRFKNIKVLGENLVVNFDKLSSKLVPVKQLFTLNFEKGFNTNELIKTKPDSVKIIGPKTALDKVLFITTEALNFKNINKSLNETIVLDTSSLPSSLKLSHQTVQLEAKVEAFTEGQVKVPITISNLPKRKVITIYPKEATVNYFVPLRIYNDIVVNDFKVICNYEAITSQEKLLFPELHISNSEIKTARVKERNIDFIITQQQ